MDKRLLGRGKDVPPWRKILLDYILSGFSTSRNGMKISM